MKAFIQDKERILDSANDLLKTRVYAENLVKVIENTPRDKVFTIGVFGGWGTGKSSIIRTAQDTIENAHRDVKFITYDAWKYANDSFRRMFLLKVQQELKMRQTSEMDRFYKSEIADAEPKTTISVKGIALAVVVIGIISIILFLIPRISIEWKVAIPTIGTLGTFLLALLNGCFYDLKISFNKPALFAPEQFEACFKEMMSKCLKETGWLGKTWTAIKDYVEVGEVSIVGLDKLVIVIDNIDRCPSDMAYQLLTDIKTFLSNANYNLVFIIPVDDEALKKHLFRRWNKQTGEDINKEKEEFLRKFFNVTLRIKPHQEAELLHFAHEINKENKLGYYEDTLAIVAKEFADNPRRIIQLLNNLSSDLALYEMDFATKHETAICVALILHEEYPSFYKEVTKNLNLVIKFDEVYKEKYGDNGSLLSFMRVADLSLRQTPFDALQRIFTNTSSIFSDLPTDIQKSVTTYDSDKVIKFADANEGLRTNLVDFIFEKMRLEVNYGARTQTTKWIDLLSSLYKVGVFDSSRFNAIDISLSRYFKSAIRSIKNQDALCYMGQHMASAGILSLRTAIIEYLTANKAEEDTNYKGILKAYLSNFTSEKDSKDIAALVESYYVDHIIDRNIDFTTTQKRVLFSDSFMIRQSESLPSIDDKTRIDDIIWCIKNNSELSGKAFNVLFSKLVELFGPTRGKSKESYIEFINSIQPILSSLENGSLSTELDVIFNVVVQSRGIPNPTYRNHPQYDTHISFLDEVDEKEAKVVTDFCYEVMRITNGSVDISTSIEKLYPKCKDAVVDGALKIHSLGISISQLASILINVDDYNSPNTLTLLEIIMTRNKDGLLKPDEDTYKNKIHSLVDNSNITGVENGWKKLVSDDEQVLGMETEYVASLDCDTINILPVSVSKLAVTTFKRENAESYRDNADFLILVLQKGNSSQKKEVVRLMKNKINNERDLRDVVKVLDNLITEDQQMLRTLVGELDAIKDSETVDEETKNQVAKLATKLSSKIKKASLLNKVLK